MLRQALIEIMNRDLLNDFVNGIFKYKLACDEYVYMQYKIVKGNIVLNIFDNGKKNRFKAYIFTLDDFMNEKNVMYINVKDCYLRYKEKRTKRNLFLLGALLYSDDCREKKEIIESLFDDISIKYVLYKHFI